MSIALSKISQNLFSDVKKLIDEAKQTIAISANASTTLLYWNVGKRINQDVLNFERAEYGQKVIISLSQDLIKNYGKGWSDKQLRHCLRFAETFPEKEIVYALSRQLSWTHFRTLSYLNDELSRSFYLQMTRIEKWTTRQLDDKIDSMLYERTAISKKPEEQIKKELNKLEETNILSPDLVFKDPYVLDFLGLEDSFSELTLENAILKELEKFLLELGQGFSFVERQKRVLIDGESFKIDLLFYHRKLKRLVAIDLKLGKFKAAYKGQMELYLRYLEKYETEEGEELPIGLILCTEGNQEQIELLKLEKSGIRVAEYITELPDKELLKSKLQRVIEIQRKRLENSSNK